MTLSRIFLVTKITVLPTVLRTVCSPKPQRWKLKLLLISFYSSCVSSKPRLKPGRFKSSNKTLGRPPPKPTAFPYTPISPRLQFTLPTKTLTTPFWWELETPKVGNRCFFVLLNEIASYAFVVTYSEKPLNLSFLNHFLLYTCKCNERVLHPRKDSWIMCDDLAFCDFK